MTVAAAAVEGLVSPEEQEAAELQAVVFEGERMTGCCRTGLPAGVNTVAVVACRHQHSAEDYR